MHCKDCEYRDKEGNCTHEKIREEFFVERWDDENPVNREVDRSDCLLYTYEEQGEFWVGPEFGCVHFEEKK